MKKESENQVFRPEFVFFDLDGTLVSHTIHDVPQSTRLAIRQLQEKGIQCVLATGRHIQELEHLPGNDIPYDAYIMLNGQMILDKNRKLIDGLKIQGKSLEHLLEMFHSKSMAVQLMELDHVYMNYVDDFVTSVLRDVSTDAPSPGTYEGSDVYMAVCYVGKEREDQLKAALPGCKITRWHPGGIDIIDGSGGKAAGIRRFLALHQTDLSEVMAFGDSENDLDMIQAAGLGVAMGNSTEDVLEAADYVTTSVDEDGIMNALIHFGIL